MAKTSVADWSTNPEANTDINGISIANRPLAANWDNAQRAVMAQTKAKFDAVDAAIEATADYAADAQAAAVSTAADAASTAADVLVTNANVVLTNADVGTTADNAADAAAAQAAAESARDAAIIGAGVYDDEATGRAAVADGSYFKVAGSGDVAAYEYKRINSITSTLISTYPAASTVTTLRSDIGGTGAALKTSRQASSMAGLIAVDTDNRKIILATDSSGRLRIPGGLDPIAANRGITRMNMSALSPFVLKALAAKSGSVVTAKLLLVGDSWFERARIGQDISDRMLALYGAIGATGWVSFNGTSNDVSPSATSIQPLGACRVTRSNFTVFDVTEGTPSGKYSLDGLRYECATTTGAITVSAFNGATFYLYYEDTTGTFRYRVDGGAWTVVAGGGTLADTKVSITGLSSSTTHTVDIDTTGNAGTVKLYGAYATGLSGVEISKIGNGSLHALDIPNFMGATGTAQMADIAADGQIIILGTNDVQSVNAVSPLYFKDALTSLHSRLTTASTYAGSLFVLPPDNGGTELFTLSQYADEIKMLAHGNPRFGFLNLYERWPDYAAISSTAWTDTLHLSTVGTGAFADETMAFCRMGN